MWVRIALLSLKPLILFLRFYIFIPVWKIFIINATIVIIIIISTVIVITITIFFFVFFFSFLMLSILSINLFITLTYIFAISKDFSILNIWHEHKISKRQQILKVYSKDTNTIIVKVKVLVVDTNSEICSLFNLFFWQFSKQGRKWNCGNNPEKVMYIYIYIYRKNNYLNNYPLGFSINYFVFICQNYLEITVCAMGTKCSSSNRIIFMGMFEKRYLYNFMNTMSKFSTSHRWHF